MVILKGFLKKYWSLRWVASNAPWTSVRLHLRLAFRSMRKLVVVLFLRNGCSVTFQFIRFSRDNCCDMLNIVSRACFHWRAFFLSWDGDVLETLWCDHSSVQFNISTGVVLVSFIHFLRPYKLPQLCTTLNNTLQRNVTDRSLSCSAQHLQHPHLLQHQFPELISNTLWNFVVECGEPSCDMYSFRSAGANFTFLEHPLLYTNFHPRNFRGAC